MDHALAYGITRLGTASTDTAAPTVATKISPPFTLEAIDRTMAASTALMACR